MGYVLTSREIPASGRGGYHRGRHQYTATGRAGYRVAKPVHRHRSLVLNGPNVNSNSSQAAGPAADDSSSSSWVTRNDRHLQLINSSVFQEQSEARARAMQQTRVQKQQEKEHHERAKLMKHLQHIAKPSTASVNPTSPTSYEILVEGVRFRVANNGSKLVKLAGDPNDPKATPKMALVGGVKFHRSKSGNMYRQAIVKAHRQSTAMKKINVICRNFSNTVAPVCQSFGSYGYCAKGISCSDRHVFECPDFSNTGVCKTKGCKLPHRERASVLRKANAALEQNASRDGEGDLSSDDDDNSVSSDDVDSDEVEEFVGEEDPTDFNKDFISLS
ncbi:CCCH zinc finger protein [Diaporthe helianthi]|uniref:CCCH zinc finger protein n=1 Tax=Diaporthe helianthi TaxID=158607 RepID=A0A2P5HXS9_DIAHE|nr:CCCH zinc finger protein [Diaporthe helianthi]